MKEPQQRQSHGPSFVAIYLIITVAIAVAVFTLKPGPEPVSLDVTDDERFIKKTAPTNDSPVPKQASDPNPPLPKPVPSLQSAITPTKAPEPKSAQPPKSSPTTTEKTDEPKNEVTVTSLEPPANPETPPAAATLTVEQEKEIDALYPLPKIRPLMEIVDHWRNIPEKAFPKLVAIRKPITFDMSQGGTMVARGKLPAGSMMVPIRLSGDSIFLKTAGAAPIAVTVPVADTDFYDSIQKRYDRFVEQAHNNVHAQRKAERNRRLGAAAYEVELSDWNDGSDPRFEPAKLSLQRGEVSTFSLLDASKWRWGGVEIVGGDSFETAFVLIISEAAFGVVEKELKVLLKNGKATRWIDLASGEAL